MGRTQDSTNGSNEKKEISLEFNRCTITLNVRSISSEGTWLLAQKHCGQNTYLFQFRFGYKSTHFKSATNILRSM